MVKKGIWNTNNTGQDQGGSRRGAEGVSQDLGLDQLWGTPRGSGSQIGRSAGKEGQSRDSEQTGRCGAQGGRQRHVPQPYSL